MRAEKQPYSGNKIRNHRLAPADGVKSFGKKRDAAAAMIAVRHEVQTLPVVASYGGSILPSVKLDEQSVGTRSPCFLFLWGHLLGRHHRNQRGDVEDGELHCFKVLDSISWRSETSTLL